MFRAYRLQSSKLLGDGAFGLVFQAEEVNSGRIVALKKSRSSQRRKRPILQYESRVLQLLQGHPAIPEIFGYGQMPHFEYMAMELLGPSISEVAKGPVSVTTATRVVQQMLSALEHVHKRGFVHRDIKPWNMLCLPTDQSKIKLIDFNISIPVVPGPPTRYDSTAKSMSVVGTLDWASLNAHNGLTLAPRDDLESLAYTAFFLLHGRLPWKNRYSLKFKKEIIKRVYESKVATTGDTFGSNVPPAFGYLLDNSRGLAYAQMPNYSLLKEQFGEVNVNPEGPLDWSAVESSVRQEQPEIAFNDEDKKTEPWSQLGGVVIAFTSSFCEEDWSSWVHQHSRDPAMTLPAEQANLAIRDLSSIVEVIKVD
ncbi:Casein kinase I isoform alpha [Leucoagaricus sp. SymC.cos]|nr:Casein kinase I isoform alpha [Leucoagaricus sp. SymC.cos]